MYIIVLLFYTILQKNTFFFTKRNTSSKLEVNTLFMQGEYEMNTYTIKEVSERSGLSHSTLRYYEDIGLLSGVIHENNKRIYTDEHRSHP
jgi:hypothetical protein